MSEPFLSEIKIVSFNFPPKGWALSNGQLLPINQNQALFSLLGTTYGGNGQTNFALPNFQGCVPIHAGEGHTLGEKAGQSSHTVTMSEMPAHTHVMSGSGTAAETNNPTGAYVGVVNNAYTPAANLIALAPAAVTNVGGSQPHNNMMPYLVLNFIIALQGIFPSPN
ncbi:MAG TPA: tail fiber protein [Pyrinomonadaceae bacterium]|nr:tail fiber protein [Pyrinomonadaceae bacterium]